MSKRTLSIIVILLALVATACSVSADQANQAGTPVDDAVVEEQSTTTTIATEVLGATETTAVEVVEETTTTTIAPVELVEETCEAPVTAARFIDVAIVDRTGGLNLRTGPGSSNDTLVTLRRGSPVTTTGACELVRTVEWFEVSSPKSLEPGWVSSSFLSADVVPTPGPGDPIDDLANVGISAPTLNELAAGLAISYGFDADLVITQVTEELALEEISSGEVTYELTGLKDDATNGFLVDISFQINRELVPQEVVVVEAAQTPPSPEAVTPPAEGVAPEPAPPVQPPESELQIVSFTALGITQTPLCSRAVSDDGLCQ